MAQPKIKDGALALSAVNATQLNGAIAGTGNSNLVQLDGTSKMPAVDGSALTNIIAPFRGARLESIGAVAIPDNVDTFISWSQLGDWYDTDTIWSGGSPTRFTIPTGVTKVKLHCELVMDNNATGFRRISLTKNGSTLSITTDNNPDAVLNSPMAITTGVISVIATDYFEIAVFQDSTASLDALSAFKKYFSIEIKE